MFGLHGGLIVFMCHVAFIPLQARRNALLLGFPINASALGADVENENVVHQGPPVCACIGRLCQ